MPGHPEAFTLTRRIRKVSLAELPFNRTVYAKMVASSPHPPLQHAVFAATILLCVFFPFYALVIFPEDGVIPAWGRGWDRRLERTSHNNFLAGVGAAIIVAVEAAILGGRGR